MTKILEVVFAPAQKCAGVLFLRVLVHEKKRDHSLLC